MVAELSGPSVLLVEDHEDTGRALSLLLRSCGIETHLARTLEQARSMAAAQRFDVALCDIGLPDGNGRDLVPFLRQHSPKAKLVAMSAYAMPSDMQDNIDAGFDLNLPKPLTVAAVLNLLRS